MSVESVAETLERDGIVLMPGLLTPEQLRSMQRAFSARLQQVRFNNVDGYEITDGYRYMVEDVLVLDQGFVDLALHPVVKGVLRRYLGDKFALTEAKGWKSVATRRDFHCWHADAWYHQTANTPQHREVKLALYLTDVKSGAFTYIKGTQGKSAPREYTNAEVKKYPRDRIIQVLAPAGTAVLFDTTGIHRQSVPMLEPRQAVFYDYHDPDVPLQAEDVRYNRYHPLVLNAAFLGGLTAEDHRILGFGDKKQFVVGFVRKPANPVTHRFSEVTLRFAHTWRIGVSLLRAVPRRLIREVKKVVASPTK
jgi:hypothetical protein